MELPLQPPWGWCLFFSSLPTRYFSWRVIPACPLSVSSPDPQPGRTYCLQWLCGGTWSPSVATAEMVLQSHACPGVAHGEVSSRVNKIMSVTYGAGGLQCCRGPKVASCSHESPRGARSERRLLALPVTGGGEQHSSGLQALVSPTEMAAGSMLAGTSSRY